MVATLLGETPSRLFNVPRIRDVDVVRGLLELHGVKVTDGPDGEMVFDPANVERAGVDEINVHAGSSRIPILLCGPLLHRLGHAFIPDLGGCHIGDRPIDFHLEALRQFGAVVDKTPEGLHLTAPNGLHGTKFDAALPERRRHRAGAADRRTRRGRHRTAQRRRRAGDHRPDLRAAEDGRDHQGQHRPGDRDRGRRRGSRGYTHRPIPDRLEAASWACAALATRGDIIVARRPPGRHDDVPQRVHARSAARSTSTTARPAAASASGTRAASCRRWRWRPTCTPAS